VSQDASVAGRYARALLILTDKQTAKAGQDRLVVLDQTLAELQGVATLVRAGTRAGAYLLNPQVSPADRRKLLESGLKDKVLPSVRVFADLLLRKKRLSMIDAIAHEFQVIVERAKGLERATLVSAVPLNDAERKRLHAELERVTGKKVVLGMQVDASLVGGAYVRIGDRVIDRSVKNLLETLANQLFEVSV
jgi:F-type H+-transporting ATPase subunit delta